MDHFYITDVNLGREIMSKGKKILTRERKLLKHVVALSGPEYVCKL